MWKASCTSLCFGRDSKNSVGPRGVISTSIIGGLGETQRGRRPTLQNSIIANSTMSLAAVRDETSTIPIVFLVVGDPIGQGFVSSLARPGGNITGFTAFEFATSAKWLELIKEIVPEVRRVAFMFNPAGGSYGEKFVQTIAPIASSSGIDLKVSPTRNAAEIDQVLIAVSGEPRGALNRQS